ncbi:MAG: hypothetical protein QXS68_03175 [Candidatus Methanomethylicaceae archaeon]
MYFYCGYDVEYDNRDLWLCISVVYNIETVPPCELWIAAKFGGTWLVSLEFLEKP